MKKLSVSIILISCLSSCSSMIEGQTQNITLNTNPPANMICDASNARGAWKLSPIQGSISSIPVKRSQSRLVISCRGDGYQGEVTNKADMEAWSTMNLLWGLSSPVAFLVDASTGALFSYDDAITVPVTPKEPFAQNPASIPSDFSAPVAAPSTVLPGTSAAPTTPAAAQKSPTYENLLKSGAIVESPAPAVKAKGH